jgi:hypothetical protein
VDFQSTQAKQKQKNFPQNLIKSWDVTMCAGHTGNQGIDTQGGT